MPLMDGADPKTAMDAELAALEQRVTQITELVARLRHENSSLRGENAALRVKVDSAMLRLQRLLEKLPEEAA